MSSAPVLVELRFDAVRITAKTIWLFVRLRAEGGIVGTGEATLAGATPAVAAAAERAGPGLLGVALTPETVAAKLRLDTLAEAAFASAVDMALLDLAAQRGGCRLAALLAPEARTSIPLYANINRRTVDRTPGGFAKSAEEALAAGHSTVKVAPFDEVTPARCREPAFEQALEPGLARVAAVRDAIGPSVPLRVDCHWRFDRAAAERLIDAVAPVAPDWVECPIAETPETVSDLVALRRRANAHDIRLAGLETGVGVEGFRPFLEAGAYDVIMPDVKYLGGLRLFPELDRLAKSCGAVVSPHNPTGPICHAASLHAAACCGALDSLELQFDESPLFDELVGGPVAAFADGAAALPRGGTGLGVELDERVIERTRIAELSRRFGLGERQGGTR